MSSVTLVSLQLIIFITNLIDLRPTMFKTVNACDLINGIHIQAATYTHSVILRVQPIVNNGTDWRTSSGTLTTAGVTTVVAPAQVRVREVIKSLLDHYSIQINDLIHVRIRNDYFDHSCWHLLRRSSIDLILFLNRTMSNDQFDLIYPPVESTYRVREHIDSVLNSENYPPQVLIKIRPDPGIVSREYSLQCNSRGNPLPRLFWSKKINFNHTIDFYYPSQKLCQNSCRIYSIQNKYQSILVFQSLISDDSGNYTCHAENPMNRTSTSVYLHIEPSAQKNLTCAPLNFCHHRGRCIFLDQQLKCLCDKEYFGDQCQTSYDEIVKKQDSDNAILLFKSRFLAGFILVLVGVLLIFLALLSWYLARNNQQQSRKAQEIPSSSSPPSPLTTKPIKSAEKTLIEKKDPTTLKTTSNGRILTPSSSLPPVETRTAVQSEPLAFSLSQESTGTVEVEPPVMRVTYSPLIEKRVLPSPPPPVSTSRRVFTRESSTATDDDDESTITNYIRHYPSLPPVNSHIDEEYEEQFSLQMNQSEELGLGYLANGYLQLTDTPTDLYQVDEQNPNLIKPLNLRSEPPLPRYTKYVSSYSKFVLPRPVFHPSLNSSQR